MLKFSAMTSTNVCQTPADPGDSVRQSTIVSGLLDLASTLMMVSGTVLDLQQGARTGADSSVTAAAAAAGADLALAVLGRMEYLCRQPPEQQQREPGAGCTLWIQPRGTCTAPAGHCTGCWGQPACQTYCPVQPASVVCWLLSMCTKSASRTCHCQQQQLSTRPKPAAVAL